LDEDCSSDEEYFDPRTDNKNNYEEEEEEEEEMKYDSSNHEDEDDIDIDINNINDGDKLDEIIAEDAEIIHESDYAVLGPDMLLKLMDDYYEEKATKHKFQLKWKWQFSCCPC